MNISANRSLLRRRPRPAVETVVNGFMESQAAVPRTLVIDDDDDVLALMRTILMKGGFHVVGAMADPVEALDLAEREQPDLILLDLHMPTIGGLEMIPLLRDRCPRTKVVVLSAIGHTHTSEAALAAGAVGYMEKGLSGRSIVKHLHRVAESGRAKIVRPYPLIRDYPD